MDRPGAPSSVPTGPAPLVLTEPVPRASGGPGPRIGPIDRGSRSLGPDLARGLMLVCIALANTWGFLYGQGPMGAGYRPVGGSTLDHVVDSLVAFLAENRTRPMFAVLFGFGISMIASRTSARGLAPAGPRRVLLRRSLALVVLGGLHAALLFPGDILMLYGMTGLVALAFVQRPPKVLWRWFAAGAVLSVGVLVVSALDQEVGYEEPGSPESYLGSIASRLLRDLGGSVLFTVTLMFVPHVVLGVLIQRAGWLQRPWEHRAVLGRIALWTAVANVALNLPWAVVAGNWWRPTGAALVLARLGHDVSGLVMGLGYVCLFGWLAARWRDRPRGLVLSAVTAVGERSLTCYVLQSCAFAPLLSAWGLGWGERIGTAQAAALAVLVWAGTACVALALHRAGLRGPLEVLMRTITYGTARPVPVPG